MPLLRHYEQLRSAMKIRPVVPATLQQFETTFNSIAAAMPEPLQPFSTTYLDPYMFRVTMALPNARIMLHRQNLSPLCSRDEVRAALSACASAAHLSVRLIDRSLQPPPPHPTAFTEPARSALPWELRVRSSTPSLVCTHLWRCILVLALSLDFSAALTCVRVSAAISDLRKINIACAKYLIFFLERLVERVRAGHGQKHMLEQDEEMLAYASGDLQEDSKGSWIWADNDSPDGDRQNPSRSANTTPVGSPEGPDSAIGYGGEWSRVETLLLALRQERDRQRPLPGFTAGPSGGDHGRSVSMGSEVTVGASPAANMTSPGGNERMNIANII
jgi:hypothetical protein